MQSLVLPVFKPAVLAGDVLSIKVVWLYDKPDKGHKDFTDWIIKDGGSGAKLKELITQAAPHTFPTPISHLETPTVLPSFELIDRAKYAGRRVTVPIQIFGENTVAYHAPKKFTVASCPLKRDNKCTGRAGAPRGLHGRGGSAPGGARPDRRGPGHGRPANESPAGLYLRQGPVASPDD